jgi:hypothetical protein
MMIKLYGSGCLIYLSTSHEFHDDQGLLWQCRRLTDLQQITKNKLGSWRYILQLLPIGQASVMAMKFQFQFTECLHVLQLAAQQKLKIIWHHAFCCWLHPWSAMCPPFSNFQKSLAASSKDMQSVPKGQKKSIWKENCCCRVSKRKTQQKNRTESAFFFLLN